MRAPEALGERVESELTVGAGDSRGAAAIARILATALCADGIRINTACVWPVRRHGGLLHRDGRGTSGGAVRVLRVEKVWAAVVRVSFMGSRKAGADNFHADRDQVAAVEQYAREMGARVEFLPPELSVSGGKPIHERPSLSAAIEGCENGTYDGIVVAYLSRLTRSRSGIEIWNRVEAAGGSVHCAAERLDTSTPNGRFIRDIHLANAVREREEHEVRFEARRAGATAAGIWQRRQTPTGYAKDPVTRRLVPDDRADDVRRAFRDAVAGVPVVHIADRLQMTPSGVRQMLKNRVYLGELKVGAHLNPAAHPALVTVDEWEAAQSQRTRPVRGKDAEPALLAGLVRCAGCGHVMSRSATKAVVYVCHGRSSAGRCPARAAVTLALLDAHVEAFARRELRRIALRAGERDDGALDEAREEVAAATREMAAYLKAVSDDLVGVEAFAAGAAARAERVEAAQARLRAVMALRPAGRALGDVDEAWERMSAHGRNQVLRGLLEAVVVRRGGGRGSRTPLGDRVRVVKHGAGLVDTRRQTGGVARGVHPILFPDLGDVGVLRELDGEDTLKGAGG